MYFNKKNNFYHGIMFHHFHDQKRHIKSQGSISAKQFERLIKLKGPDKFLTPYDFMDKCQNKALKKNDLCLTFDDSLKCQFDIAESNNFSSLLDDSLGLNLKIDNALSIF